jgi:hypothetical protein
VNIVVAWLKNVTVCHICLEGMANVQISPKCHTLGQFVTYFHTMKFYIENNMALFSHSTPKINSDGAFLALGLKAGGRGIWFGVPLCHFASFNNNNNNNNSLQAPVKI